jgi:hypothetical protein
LRQPAWKQKGQGKESDNSETAGLVKANPLMGGFESIQTKKRPTSKHSFNSDLAGLVMANPIAKPKSRLSKSKR